jgi:hypothetical protein
MRRCLQQAGQGVPSTHPRVQRMVDIVLPVGHPPVDDLLADPAAHPLPVWHPTLETVITRRPQWRPGHYLVVIVGIIFLLTFATSSLHLGRKWRRAAPLRKQRTEAEVCAPRLSMSNLSLSLGEDDHQVPL